ncbi:hypothetical protein AAGX10_13625, partial [Staphylococcus aureus]
FFVFAFYFDVLDIKKETLRSQLAWQRSTLAERKLPFLTCDNRLLLSSPSALTYSFSSTKLVALFSRFVRFCLATFYSSGT